MNSQSTSDPVQQLEPRERVEPAECAEHGAYESKVFAVHPDAKPIRLGCPKCSEQRRIEEARREEKRRLADQAYALEQRLGSIGIPERFSDRTLANYVATSDAQKRALEVVSAVAASTRKGDSMILCGKPGTGKTHLACGVARHFAETGRTAKFGTVLSAIRHVKSTYRANSDQSESDAINDLLLPDLLILDEVGVQIGSEHEKMVLFEIINERYQDCRSTILISNLTRDELGSYLGDRIMDRFREAGAVVAFDWASHRGQRAA